jgi:hypothetical protein
MNQDHIRQACYNIGLVEPISIEPDGTVWTGTDDNRTYIDNETVDTEVVRLNAEKVAAKQAILDRLGLTEDEAKVIFG